MTSTELYKPFFFHAINRWVDRLQFSRWLLYLLLFVAIAAAQHSVAWIKGALAVGQFNLYLTFSSAWIIEMLILGHYLEYGAADILAEFRPLMEVDDEQFDRLRYKFTMIPWLPGTLTFLLGMVFGFFISGSVRQISPAINFVFPELTIGVWMFSNGLGFAFTYQIIRQMGQIRHFFRRIERIDLYNLDPLYAFSKMTAVIGLWVFVTVYLTPLLLDPASLRSQIVIFQTYFFIIVTLAIFYIPLAEVNRRLVAEKEAMIRRVTSRIEQVLGRIHAAIEENELSELADLRSAFGSLREEKAMMEAIPTWPWRPATFRGFISAILLPLFIWLVQQVLSRFI